MSVEKALWQCFRMLVCCAGQNLKTPSKLGYLDMDVSGQRKADQQPSKLPLSQGRGSRRVTLDSGTLHSILRKEPYAEQREKVQHQPSWHTCGKACVNNGMLYIRQACTCPLAPELCASACGCAAPIAECQCIFSIAGIHRRADASVMTTEHVCAAGLHGRLQHTQG